MGYKWFAIWTKDNFPFVCLEPWHSHTDFEEVKVDFEKREGTIILKPNNSYTTSYTIEIF
jgi:galactose mutarotase-like enzyme